MSIIRGARRQRFTMMDNATLEDASLSFGAVGLLAYVLSKPDNWVIRTREIMARGGIGRGAYTTLINELRDAGYAELQATRGEGGRVGGTQWVVSECPVFRHSAEPTLGKPAVIVKTEALPKTENTTKDLAPNVTALGTARAAPAKSKAARPAKPLFDAFRAAFPNAHSSMAGRFDATCTERGFTVDLWHAFMATADARRDYLRGALTMGNALNRFVAWCGDQAPAPLPSDRPAGAPDNWRSLVYSYDGTKLWPALALPRMGLDPHAPPASWPAWYRAFEGVAA